MTSPSAYLASPPPSGARRRSIAPWWVAAIPLGIGALLAVLWFVFGGLPITNHAAFGRVPVPGVGAVTLPAGTVWIHFEEDGVFGEDDSAQMPSDLVVSVSSSGGGQSGAVPINRVSENLFSSTTGETGHVPYGTMNVPEAGTYDVTTAATQRTSAVAPRMTFGEPPLNPFGPPIVGALIVFAPFALLALLLVAPIRPARRPTRPAGTSPNPIV